MRGMAKPNGIDDGEYEKVIQTRIKQSFGGLCYNSQTLVQKNYVVSNYMQSTAKGKNK